MDPKSAAVKLAGWEQIIIAANNSGMKKKEWCEQNGVNEKKFYYWQRKVRFKAIETMRALKTSAALDGQMAGGAQTLTVTQTQSDFVEVSIPGGFGCASEAHQERSAMSIQQPEIVLEIEDCRLYIQPGIQEQTLAVVLKAIRHA